MSASTKTTQDWTNLCQAVRALVPDKTSKDAWVWITAATLASSPPGTDLLASFCTHLTNKYPELQSEEQKSRILVCFRDVLLKLITFVGAPRVLCVLGPLAKAERDVEVKSNASVLNEKWNPESFNPQSL